ncbi:MAG: hypothetical protein RL117_2043 [Verrucomicrobiota bacterium]|jgi:LacI family transcriptional regulator
MRPSTGLQEPLRIVALWHEASFFGQRILAGMYRQASFSRDVNLRHYLDVADTFHHMCFDVVKDWQPHGVITRISDPIILSAWRKAMPDIPFVSALVVPKGIVDTIIGMDPRNAIEIALEHFRSRGVNHFAYFFSSDPLCMEGRQTAFKALAPQGHWINFHTKHLDGIMGLHSDERDQLAFWLQSLPKPVGIICLEVLGARNLMSFCQELGYDIPRDIQIIGADDVDQALSVTPHLTTVDAPCDQIGEKAFEVLLSHIQGDEPKPASYIEVGGCQLIARGSTGLTSVGMERVATAVNLMRQGSLKGMTAGKFVKKAKVSHTTFYKEFRENTGTTPAKQLRETRLKKACAMLVETDASVSDIAEECGFSGGNYFARFFRNTMGVTPTEYRERNQRKRHRDPSHL